MRLFEALLQPGQTGVVDADSDAAPRVLAVLRRARPETLHCRREGRGDHAARKPAADTLATTLRPAPWRPRIRVRPAARGRLPGRQRAGRRGSRHRRRATRRRGLRGAVASSRRARPAGARRRDATARRSLSTTPIRPTRWRRCFRPCGRCRGAAHRRLRLRRRPRPGQASANGRDRRARSPTRSSSPTTIRAARTPAAIRAAILAGAREVDPAKAARSATARARSGAPSPARRRATARRRRQGT